MKEETELIKQLASELLEKLLIKGTVEVSGDEENQVVNLQVETEDSGYLIGYHGETLEAFQLILSLMVYKKLAAWKRLVVNVGNYRQDRQEQLKKLALNVAQKVKFSGESQVIPNLSPSERRMVHLALADHADVFSESEGEGEERRLVIKPKKSK